MFGEDGEYDPRDDPINKYMESAGTMVNVAIESADQVLNRYFGGCNVFGSNSRQDDTSRIRRQIATGTGTGIGRARGGETSLLDTTQKAINERYNANGNEPLPLPESDLDALADLKFVRIEYRLVAAATLLLFVISDRIDYRFLIYEYTNSVICL